MFPLSVVVVVTFPIFVFFSRTTGPISTNYEWYKAFLGDGNTNSNEGSCYSPRNDHSKIAKISYQLVFLYLLDVLQNSGLLVMNLPSPQSTLQKLPILENHFKSKDIILHRNRMHAYDVSQNVK